ncbi:ABC transporter ATP-binding protein [Neorhizobium lilium]|uniref:ABC transporter ATP-binding protein n=1 Tax=Neorhizobium lilium TaxID=2503024 RepID=A0A444LL55_9HYPH|nr:ABC transporter ATP-binding protein [Neorhizobium lilium]RWX81065.1 ABC transporter ATP-binding protein [Neorhizobium lilium]
MAHLSADNISVAFAGLKALSSVTLDIRPGQISGLIGPNGAGKTTLVNVLTGFQMPTEGSVNLDGKPLTNLKPHQVRRLGIARTFQGGRLFRDLAVIDNLEVTGVGLGMSRRAAVAEAEAMLDWIGISALGGRAAGTLPYTDERRVAIGRALMGRPAFILLDEPAAGMSAQEATDLSSLVKRIARDLGCGVLIIEHNVGLVLGLCDHIVVLDSGAVIEEGTPTEIRQSEKVRHAYMGTAADTALPVAEVLL